MLFSSLEFLYYFLPVTLLVYFLIPMPCGSPKLRNHWILFTSLVFYGWGEPRFLILMLAQSTCGWVFGLLLERFRGKKGGRIVLVGSVLTGISSLMFFKYADFFLSNLNRLPGLSVPLFGVIMPIGISFYTFQILSYNFDVYLGKIKAQRNFFTLFTYIAIFPALIAGPIVRYTDLKEELIKRGHSIELFACGVRRFTIGLGKKVLIANIFGELVAIYKSSGDASVLGAWLYIVAFAFHVYFDFSGYSDMAIGMGKMLGFHFPENFNYPYIAKSVTDFWRRWHMSLSYWFRDYVYIPLGGNRVKLPKLVFNILVVWFLTGFWHGANWNFIAWGAYFGVLLLLEKFFFGKLIAKLPGFFSHLYLILCVIIGWTIFDNESIGLALTRMGYMLGVGTDGVTSREMLYYFRSYLVPICIAFVGCTPLPARIANHAKSKHIMTVFEPLAVAFIIISVTAYLVDGSFNPFIYFRF
jgi:alginate O-acetyltransferase complex protein AlgI